jgi:hypothetical protein
VCRVAEFPAIYRRFALVSFVAIDLLDIAARAVEQRVRIFVAVSRFGPVIVVRIGHLFVELFGDGLANRVEPIGDRLKIILIARGNGTELGVDSLRKLEVFPPQHIDLGCRMNLVVQGRRAASP